MFTIKIKRIKAFYFTLFGLLSNSNELMFSITLSDVYKLKLEKNACHFIWGVYTTIV